MKVQKEFHIYENFIENFFFRIDSKKHIIQLFMETIRYILSYENKKCNYAGKIILHKNKMSRIFFFTEGKYFSVYFPFSIDFNDKELKIYYKSIEINYYIVTKILEIIKSEKFISEDIYTFMEAFEDTSIDSDICFFTILRDLILLEDGYIRYDVDKKTYEEYRAKDMPNVHPEHHYDLFYSNQATFKLGLKKHINEQHFIDLLDITTDCNFVAK